MLKTWSQINKEWFAKGSRPPRKAWLSLVQSGEVVGKIIADTPYIEEDFLAANINLSQHRADDIPNLLE